MEQALANEQTTPTGKALTYQTRFGEVTLREDRLISFPTGILGFNDCTVFGLSKIPNADESPLLLLQCVNEPEVCFLVADPAVLGLDIKAEDMNNALTESGMDKTNTQFLVILTMYEQENSHYLTANLRAPILIDSVKRTALQHILSNKDYTTQHKI